MLDVLLFIIMLVVGLAFAIFLGVALDPKRSHIVKKNQLSGKRDLYSSRKSLAPMSVDDVAISQPCYAKKTYGQVVHLVDIMTLLSNQSPV